MAKVAYNACNGGFSLSRLAAEHLAAMGVEEAVRFLEDQNSMGHDFRPDIRHLPRHDPRLVTVVEELGAKANGCHSDLRICHWKGSCPYVVQDDDGRETVLIVNCDGVALSEMEVKEFLAVEAVVTAYKVMNR